MRELSWALPFVLWAGSLCMVKNQRVHGSLLKVPSLPVWLLSNARNTCFMYCDCFRATELDRFDVKQTSWLSLDNSYPDSCLAYPCPTHPRGQCWERCCGYLRDWGLWVFGNVTQRGLWESPLPGLRHEHSLQHIPPPVVC